MHNIAPFSPQVKFTSGLLVPVWDSVLLLQGIQPVAVMTIKVDCWLLFPDRLSLSRGRAGHVYGRHGIHVR